MKDSLSNEDKIWAEALNQISQQKDLGAFYRLSRKRLRELMLQHGQHSIRDIRAFFESISKPTPQEQDKALKEFLSTLPEERFFTMLLVLGRSMKCWVESENPFLCGSKRRWKVANA